MPCSTIAVRNRCRTEITSDFSNRCAQIRSVVLQFGEKGFCWESRGTWHPVAAQCARVADKSYFQQLKCQRWYEYYSCRNGVQRGTVPHAPLLSITLPEPPPRMNGSAGANSLALVSHRNTEVRVTYCRHASRTGAGPERGRLFIS